MKRDPTLRETEVLLLHERDMARCLRCDPATEAAPDPATEPLFEDSVPEPALDLGELEVGLR